MPVIADMKAALAQQSKVAPRNYFVLAGFSLIFGWKARKDFLIEKENVFNE
ncbi:MAG: hypothetical protein JWN01_278 [Patescibacteria group bacterium]|nr:hypothetical protein [Patescibacteria group bacterium]